MKKRTLEQLICELEEKINALYENESENVDAIIQAEEDLSNLKWSWDARIF